MSESVSSPLDRIEAVVAGWRDQGTWRAFREDWFPETLEALVNVAKAAEDIERRVVDGPEFDIGEIFNSAGRLAKALAVLGKEPT